MIDIREATGRGVRVAIVDSGVNARHPHVGGVIGGYGVNVVHGVATVVDDHRDVNGHGTACAGVVRWGAPAADLVAVRVLDADLTAPAAVIECALRHLFEVGVHVANLSLGIPEPETAARLAPLVRALGERGTILVSAVRPDGRPSWPSDDPWTIAVEAHASLPHWSYRRTSSASSSAVFVANPYPRPIPGRPPEMNFAGPSFAAPRIAALVARALEVDPSLDRQGLITTLTDSAVHFAGPGGGGDTGGETP